jgi:hypothetical protein
MNKLGAVAGKSASRPPFGTWWGSLYFPEWFYGGFEASYFRESVARNKSW